VAYYTIGGRNDMHVSEGEMETILTMYKVVCWEGQDTDAMMFLAERIEKEKKNERKEEELKQILTELRKMGYSRTELKEIVDEVCNGVKKG